LADRVVATHCHGKPGIMAGGHTIEHGTYLDEECAAAMRETGAILIPTRTFFEEVLEVEHVDVVADRGNQRLYAEAKGRTAPMGLDVDTLYGQLLRRMPADQVGTAVFAVVVPDSAVKTPERVP
jgi:hypothetical protein